MAHYEVTLRARCSVVIEADSAEQALDDALNNVDAGEYEFV